MRLLFFIIAGLVGIIVQAGEHNRFTDTSVGAERLRGIGAGIWLKEDFTVPQRWGCNAVRLIMAKPAVSGQGKDCDLTEETWAALLAKLESARKSGVKVIIDFHTHTPFFPQEPWNSQSLDGWISPENTDSFVAMWQNIAKRLGDGPYRETIAAYELLNEPVPPRTPEGYAAWNDIAARTTAAIRKFDRYHTIIVGAADFSNPSGMSYLQPTGDPNTIYSFHMYMPHEFTEQGTRAEWPFGAVYPGKIKLGWKNQTEVMVDRKWLEDSLAPVCEFQKKYGARIQVGEFSAMRGAPDDSALRYLTDVLEIFERNHWDWSYHAYRSGVSWDIELPEDRRERKRQPVTARLQLLQRYWSKNRHQETATAPVQLPPHLKFEVIPSSVSWHAIQLPHFAPPAPAYDLSSLLHQPAGKYGFVTTGEDGHFYYADGKRARFWGVAIQDGTVAPEHISAERFAANLAINGCNMVRVHLFDWYLSAALAEEKTGNLSPENAQRLDRFDYLIHCLKKNGVYLYLDLNDCQSKMRNIHKSAFIWSKELRDDQKEYARLLLNRVNQYTGIKLVEDPMMAMVEIINESSFWWNSPPENAESQQKDELQAEWNRWLRRKYHDQGQLVQSWHALSCAVPPHADLARADLPLCDPHENPDFSRFCYEATCTYYREMRDFLRNELSVKVPVTGHNSPFSAPDLAALARETDFISTHFYWSTAANSALDCGLEDFWNLLPQIAASKVKGKPLLVTEYNAPAPNPYRAEAAPILIASLLSQDIDGVIFFNYAAFSGKASFEKWPDTIWNFRFLPNDPLQWGQFAWGAAAFFNRYLQPNPGVTEVAMDEENVFALTRDSGGITTEERSRAKELGGFYRWRTALARDEQAYTQIPSLFRSPEIREPFLLLPYLSRVERSFADAPGVILPDGEKISLAEFRLPSLKPVAPEVSFDSGPMRTWLDRISSQTGAASLIALNHMLANGIIGPENRSWFRDLPKRQIIIDTPCLQGVAGKMSPGQRLHFQGMELEIKTPWASIFLCSLDGKKLEESERMLLTAVGTAVNSGQKPKDRQSDWFVQGDPDLGHGPVLFNPVSAAISLHGDPSRPIRVRAVIPDSMSAGRELDVVRKDKAMEFAIGQEPAIQFLLERKTSQ